MNRRPNISNKFTYALEMGNVAVEFIRTCRIPATEGYTSMLPANCGKFPVYNVADYSDTVPEEWKLEGCFIPMDYHEAMWMNFRVKPGAVVAMLIAAGRINVVTGDDLEAMLRNDPQNYIVCPPQPWIDGFMMEGKVRQFVASILGEGETVEEQLTGEAEFGGIQIGVFDPKINLIPDQTPLTTLISGKIKPSKVSPFYPPPYEEEDSSNDERPVYRSFSLRSSRSSVKLGATPKGISSRSMGLGAGGMIKQKIMKDDYVIGSSIKEVWHDKPSHKAWVYIIDHIGFKVITGEDAPPSPITRETYQKLGYPWFDLKDGHKSAVESTGVFDKVKPVGETESPLHEKNKIDKTTHELW